MTLRISFFRSPWVSLHPETRLIGNARHPRRFISKAMRPAPMYVHCETYYCKDRSRSLVHRVSARQHGGNDSRLNPICTHFGRTPGEADGAEDSREAQARREEELGDYAQGHKPRRSIIPPAELFSNNRDKALPHASAAPPLSVSGEEWDAYEATVRLTLIIELHVFRYSAVCAKGRQCFQTS